MTTKRHVLVAWIVGYAVGIVPFMIVYGPVWLQGNWRDFSAIVDFAPAFSDIINVGPHNWAWSWLVRAGLVGGAGRPRGELDLGFTPGVAFVCVLMTILALRSWVRTASRDTESRTVVVIALGVALAACWLVQLSYFGLRPWYAIWVVVPGASAVRTTFRFQIVLNLAAALLVALALDRIRFRWLRRGPLVATATAGIIAGVLIVEQISRAPVTFSRAGQLAWLHRLPPPPAHCRAFYLAPGAARTGVPWWVIQSDAMLLAVRFGIPTLNGNASIYPANWRLSDPLAPDYLQALRDWSARKGLTSGLCGLQSSTGPWIEGSP